MVKLDENIIIRDGTTVKPFVDIIFRTLLEKRIPKIEEIRKFSETSFEEILRSKVISIIEENYFKILEFEPTKLLLSFFIEANKILNAFHDPINLLDFREVEKILNNKPVECFINFENNLYKIRLGIVYLLNTLLVKYPQDIDDDEVIGFRIIYNLDIKPQNMPFKIILLNNLRGISPKNITAIYFKQIKDMIDMNKLKELQIEYSQKFFNENLN